MDRVVERKFIKELDDTDQLMKYLQDIELNDTILISTKIHGTSVIFGNTYIPNKVNWFQRITSKLFRLHLPALKWGFVVSSRRVIKSLDTNTLDNKAHWYESGDIWTKVCSKYKDVLPKGFIFYGEIIGYEPGSSKEIQKDYSYGIQEGFCELVIYKITKIDETGYEFDLDWEQIKTLCNSIGLKHVQEVFYNKTAFYINNFMGEGVIYTDENWRREFADCLKKEYLDKEETYKFSEDWKGVTEGICLRVEKFPKIKTYKMKSPEFLLKESKNLDKEVVDVEANENV